MQYAICSRDCSKSSPSVLGRKRSLSSGGTMRFLRKVFTSRVRVVKNHNFLHLSSFLHLSRDDNASSRVGVYVPTTAHAQPTLARSETCSMECPLISWTVLHSRILEGCQKLLLTTETSCNPPCCSVGVTQHRVVTYNNRNVLFPQEIRYAPSLPDSNSIVRLNATSSSFIP